MTVQEPYHTCYLALMRPERRPRPSGQGTECRPVAGGQTDAEDGEGHLGPPQREAAKRHTLTPCICNLVLTKNSFYKSTPTVTHDSIARVRKGDLRVPRMDGRPWRARTAFLPQASIMINTLSEQFQAHGNDDRPPAALVASDRPPAALVASTINVPTRWDICYH